MDRSWRYAYVEMSGEASAEKHVELVSHRPGSWSFKEIPGPGPNLDDFGKFDTEIWMTADEAKL